ncbi:MAG: hypothetical protein H0T66_07900 [Geodermatophilaceae bacterium]|nr:hypothetical protein [Geodermatophilaceae bacterium]
MRLGLPGPSDVLALAGSLRDAVSSALDLLPRVTALVEQAEVVLARVEAVVESAERTVEAAHLTISSAQATTAAAAQIVEATAQTTQAAGETVAGAAGTVVEVTAMLRKLASTQRRADDAVAGAQGLVNRVDPLLSSYEAPLRTLAPVVATLANTTSEREVTAGVSLVDRLPTLIAHVDEDLLPLLARLDQVGPDLHELLEVTQDLHRVVTGLPGVGFLRRRGDDEPPADPETA